MARSVEFYYDIVCPFAYTASHLVRDLATRTGATVHWRPVLLGGLYEATAAPQGKDGSAMDIMAPNKLRLTSIDLQRQMCRHGVHGSSPEHHPQRTLYAMRVLAGMEDVQLRELLSHAFFKAYWQEGRNVEEVSELQSVADRCAPGLDLPAMAKSAIGSSKLRANTQEAADRGAFGVPSFYMSGKLLWGVDRMFFVERLLGQEDAQPDRLALPPPQPSASCLTFYFDYSSPWTYLACEQLQGMIDSVSPVNVKLEWVPVLLGAIFKKIGTPLVPASQMSVAKQQYYSADLQRWAEYAKVPVRWPDFFPLRSVLPLRVTVAAGCNQHLIYTLFRAVWRDNLDISSPQVLEEVLKGAGFPAGQLLHEATTESIKSQLFSNTARALDEGLCGLPSFQVNNGPVLWGQDRMNVVADMLCGWHDPPYSKL